MGREMKALLGKKDRDIGRKISYVYSCMCTAK